MKGKGSPRRNRPEPDLSFGLTETHAAERLVALAGNDLRYDHARKQWFLYRDPVWMPDRDGEVSRLAIASAQELYRRAESMAEGDTRKKLLSFAKYCLSDAGIRKVTHIASQLHPITRGGEDWDPNPWLLALPNGVMNLRTGRLRRARREDLLTLSANVGYDRDARCPQWERFLDEVFDSDAGLIKYLQRCTGYMLTGSANEQVWWTIGSISDVATRRVSCRLLLQAPTQANTGQIDRFAPIVALAEAERQCLLGAGRAERRTSRVSAPGRAVRIARLNGRRSPRAGSGGARGGHASGDLGRQPQMSQEALDHRGIFDQGDQPQTPPTPWAVEHLKAEAPAHQVCPARAGPVWSIRSDDSRIR